MFKINKVCGTCGRHHKYINSDIAVPLANGMVIEGMLWFNCKCGSTLVYNIKDKK